MRRRFHLLLLPLFFATATAVAQDEGASKVERERRIEETIARLRNPSPIFVGDPERIRTLVQELMSAHSPRADQLLRDILTDGGTHPNVVEQTAMAAVFDPDHRFVTEVVERLRLDQGGSVEQRLAPLWRRVDTTTVRLLTELALDITKGSSTRRTATRLLGQAGDGFALETLVSLWDGSDRTLRDEAHTAFDALLPVGVRSAAEARTLVEAMRKDDIPYAEVLRRALRERAPVASAAPAEGVPEAYRKLAEEILPTATPDQILRLFVLGSPVAEVRRLGARRLAEFQYDPTRDTDVRLRAARGLFDVLRRETDPAVETEVLRALAVLAPATRGSVGAEDMAALIERGDPRSPRTTPERRAIVTRLLGELRDPRGVEPLEGAFDFLAGGDHESRLAILDSLQMIPKDVAPWVMSRVASERDVRVVRKFLSLLARSKDKGVVQSLRDLLRTHDEPTVRLDAARALGTLWAGTTSADARDALLIDGLRDRDENVRRTCAAALGFAGPGGDQVLPRLAELIRNDADESVRLAGAKSILDLDSARAVTHLAPLLGDRPEVWPLWRDHMIEGLGTRDATPERLMAMADSLADGGDRAHALDLLRGAATDRGSAWSDVAGRNRVRERLASVLLDEGSPIEAEEWVRKLLAVSGKDEPLALRCEVLLTRALVNSGERARWLDAETRLVALRTNPRLPAPLSLEAAVVLGDCRLRLDDPGGALSVLELDFAAAPDRVRLLRDQLLERAKTRAAEDAKLVYLLVDQLNGTDAEAAAQASVRLRALGARAARPISISLAQPDDLPVLRRFVNAAAAVLGRAPDELPAELSRERIADVARRTRESLLAAPRFGTVTPNSK